MKTDVSRDGQDDWTKGVKVGRNDFSYPLLAEAVASVPEEDIKKTREEAVRIVQKERKNNAEHS